MARTKGSYSLAGTIEVLADAPADARLQVKTVAELTASGSFPYKYVGMIVSVEATQDAYMLIGSDPTVPANWRKMGESQVRAMSDLSDVDVTNIQDGEILKWDATNREWVNAEDSGGVSDYADLTSKPSINNVTLSGNKTTSDLGISYNDLTNKPTIPTKVSDLTNDSGFITDADVPTKTSDLTNDSGFITSSSVPTKVSDLTNDSGYITSASVSSLTDTTISSPSDGQILTYDETNNKWVNGNASATIDELGDIDDVDLTSLQNGQTIIWDATNSKWKNGSITVPTKTSDLTNDSGFLTSVSASDVGLGSVVNTGDSDTPVQNGTTKFTTGGAYTELAKKADKPTVLNATLTAGSTSVTFSNVPTSGDYLITVYTSAIGLDYDSISQSGSTVTVTYPAQSSSITVYLKIEGV